MSANLGWQARLELTVDATADEKSYAARVRIREQSSVREVQEILDSHPDVARSVVVADGQRRTAYVMARQTSQDDESSVEEWQALFDYVYLGTGPGETTFDTSGWASTYTGADFGGDDMREWVDETVARIRTLPGRRVLELGCGTGLLLHRLAADADLYLASDFSSHALDRIRRRFDGQLPGNVRLHQATADDLHFTGPGSVDTVVINSVVQYFPDDRYLTRVLADAADVVAEKGVIFVGDVRSAALNRAFCAGVELSAAAPDTPREEVQARVERRCCGGTELLVDPRYFLALHEALPRLAHVAIMPRRGRRATEMNRYRFDAILFLDAVPDRLTDVPEWSHWADAGRNVKMLRRLLIRDAPATAGFLGVPNLRTAGDHLAATLLERPDGPPTAADIRRVAYADQGAVDPADLWALGDALSYDVQLSWARAAQDGSFDLAFVRRTAEPGGAPAPAAFPAEPVSPGQCASRPWRTVAESLDPTELRAFLRARLPEAMLPTRFVILEHLPLTADGDIDVAELTAVQWA